MSARTPAYLKDETGFCYAYAPGIADLPHLSAWDGEVDAHGFATDAKVDKKSGKGKKAEPVAEPTADPSAEPAQE